MNKKEKIIDSIQEMTTTEVIALHNEYCYETNNYDNEILDIDRLDEICNGQDAYWIACRIYFGEFHPQADYFIFNGYGNIKSLFNYEIADYIDENEIADYIIENNNYLYNDDIKKILEDDSEDETEE